MQFELREILSRFAQKNIYQNSIEFNNSCVSIEIKRKLDILSSDICLMRSKLIHMSYNFKRKIYVTFIY